MAKMSDFTASAAGKGPQARPCKFSQYQDNFEHVFGNKRSSKTLNPAYKQLSRESLHTFNEALDIALKQKPALKP